MLINLKSSVFFTRYTNSPKFSVIWVIVSNNIVTSYFQIAIIRFSLGVEIRFWEAYNIRFVDGNVGR